MVKIKLLILSVAFALSSYAQGFKSMDYGISLTPLVKNNLSITNSTDNHILYSRPVVSGELSVFFELPLKYDIGLRLAAGIAYDPQNIGFKETEFQLPNNISRMSSMNNTEYLMFNKYIFPISVFKRLPLDKHTLNIEVGLKWNKFLNYPYSEQGSVLENNALVFESKMKSIHNNNTFVSYFAKVGIVQSIKQHQLLVNMVFNYSPRHIGEGTFNFHHLKNDSYGKLEQNLNFIGIELAYSLPTLK